MPMPRDRFASPLKAALVPILKLCTLLILYIVMQVGWHANLHSAFYREFLQKESSRTICDEVKKCPTYSFALESIFHFVTIVSFLLSIASLVGGFLYPTLGAFQRIDKGFHFFAGGLLFISGCLIIFSAVKIDGFRIIKGGCDKDKLNEQMIKSCNNQNIEDRVRDKYVDKIIAGTFCFIITPLYILISMSILSNVNGGGSVAPMTLGRMERPPNTGGMFFKAPEEPMTNSSMAEDLSAADLSESVEPSDVGADSHHGHHHKDKSHHSRHGSHKDHGSHHHKK